MAWSRGSGALGGIVRAIPCSTACSRPQTIRLFSSTEKTSNNFQVFDRNVKRMQRNRAVLNPNARAAEQLKDEIAWQISDRINDIDRTFDLVLDVGCGRGHIGQHLDTDLAKQLVQCDMSHNMLAAFDDTARDRHLRLCLDEETLPFSDNTFDAVVSSLSLHWVNDLPGVLTQIKNILKPDGVFVGAMFGGETLYELRCSLQLAETERLGGFAPHISPMAEMRDAGSLLNRAGFTLLTVDIDEICINYPSMFELLDDLKLMGETNAALKRPVALSRDILTAAASVYQSEYGNEDGTIPATFQVLHMVGWKPHPSQPSPARRGSATKSLKALKQMGVDLDKLGLNDDGTPKETKEG